MRRLPLLAWLLLPILPFLFTPTSSAQQATAEADPTPTTTAAEPKSLATIGALRTTIAAVEADLEAKQAELEAATTQVAKESLAGEIKALGTKLASLRTELESIASGVDVTRLDNLAEERVAFEDEVREFFRPLLQEASRAMSKPRELEKLRNEVSYQTTRLEMADRAIKQLGELIAKAQDEDTKASLVEMEEKWIKRRAGYDNELTTARYLLDESLANKESLWKVLSSGVAKFIRTRGKNIVLAIGCMLLTFLLLRFIHRGIANLGPARRRASTFSWRLFEVFYYGITVLLTLCAGLAAFYALGDWALLGFSLLLIAGLVWASKNTIPLVGEQVKLMLNLGPVREGERLVFNGVPWQVDKINVYSRLTNPALEGGELRLPLRDLIPLNSRPFADKEPFFPCEKGHWLLLADGTYGKVVRQTPEWVQLVLLGSSVKTFSTAEFIAQNPENLSLGFRLRGTFGIDYSHQEIATTEAPTLLQEKLVTGLGEVVGSDNIVNIRVEFASAGASSLDLAILADISGEAASKYNQVRRAIQRICVDACNQHGWTIPFTQITLHNAPGD